MQKLYNQKIIVKMLKSLNMFRHSKDTKSKQYYQKILYFDKYPLLDFNKSMDCNYWFHCMLNYLSININYYNLNKQFYQYLHQNTMSLNYKKNHPMHNYHLLHHNYMNIYYYNLHIPLILYIKFHLICNSIILINNFHEYMLKYLSILMQYKNDLYNCIYHLFLMHLNM